MITLKEALTKSKEELAEIIAELEEKAKASDLNAYVGFESSDSMHMWVLNHRVRVCLS